jgi:hypothetical protein
VHLSRALNDYGGRIQTGLDGLRQRVLGDLPVDKKF